MGGEEQLGLKTVKDSRKVSKVVRAEIDRLDKKLNRRNRKLVALRKSVERLDSK